MKGTFGDKTSVLSARVGYGDLRGTLRVDQIYAEIQHRRRDFRHPRGGQAEYLRVPLALHRQAWVRDLATSLLRGSAAGSMKRAMEQLNQLLKVYAPVKYNNLRQSGAIRVMDGYELAHSRSPRRHRLSRRELREQGRRRRARR